MKNMKLIQAIMQHTGDMFEVQYYILENFFYWKSKEKTLLTLNLSLISFVALVPLWVIPLRYLIVAGLWLIVSLSSPFCVAVGRSILQLLIEYGIVLERMVPTYMTDLMERIDKVYIPRAQRIMRWIPFLCRWVEPVAQVTPPQEQTKSSQRSIALSNQPQQEDERPRPSSFLYEVQQDMPFSDGISHI